MSCLLVSAIEFAICLALTGLRAEALNTRGRPDVLWGQTTAGRAFSARPHPPAPMLGFEARYHGQRFAGWHRQAPDAPGEGCRCGSVQATLERAAAAALAPEVAADVRLNALSDVASAKGAHSRGQLCFFRATPEALALVASGQPRRPALDPALASHCVLGPLRALGEAWPRPSRLRVRYYILQGEPQPDLAPFAWYVREPLPLESLQRAVSVLVGTHDLGALTRRKGGRGARGTCTISRATATRLPASAAAFDLRAGPGAEAAGSAGADAARSWLLQLELVTGAGSGLPRQLVQRLAALLRRLASTSQGAAEGAAEQAMRDVLEGRAEPPADLAVAPARGLWLEEVTLQESNRPKAAEGCAEGGEAAAAPPPAKRPHCSADAADTSASSGRAHQQDEEEDYGEAEVHTMSSRALLAVGSGGACWVGPSKSGSQRLRTSDYDRLLQRAAGASEPPLVVGVNSAALPQFLGKVWPRVHPETRCVLVSGDSDWGVPGELWSKHREELPPLRELLEDRRLRAWYTQNFDFGFGCHLALAHSCCSAEGVDGVNDAPLDAAALARLRSALSPDGAGSPLRKLRPLPIGLPKNT